MKNSLFVLATLCFALLAAKPASAAIDNGNFEKGTDPGSQTRLSKGSTKIDDWKVTSGNIDYVGSYWEAASGDRSIDLNGDKKGAISQTFPTVDGKVYFAVFAMSGNPTGGDDLKKMVVRADGKNPWTFYYNTDKHDTSRSDMNWRKKAYKFVATGKDTKLTFTSGNSGSKGPALDNVRLVRFSKIAKKYSSLEKDDCKKGGWTTFGEFKNQGNCVSYFQSNKKSKFKNIKWNGKKWKNKKKK